MRMRNKESGITLLEVLIAVLIVGIIATAAVPMLGSYTEKAREARAEANMIVKAQAIDRYNMDHQAPLGMAYDQGTGELVDYGLASLQGPAVQLLNPTDVNGNVLGDPVAAAPGPFSHGPYLAEIPPEPASFLLAASAPLQKRCAIAPSAVFLTFNYGNGSGMQAQVAYQKALPAFGDKGVFQQGTDARGWINWMVEGLGPVPLGGDEEDLAHVAVIVKGFADAAARVSSLVGTGKFEAGAAILATQTLLDNVSSAVAENSKGKEIAAEAAKAHELSMFRMIFTGDALGEVPFVKLAMAEGGWNAKKDELAIQYRGDLIFPALMTIDGERQGYLALRELWKKVPAEVQGHITMGSKPSWDATVRPDTPEQAQARHLFERFKAQEIGYLDRLGQNAVRLGIRSPLTIDSLPTIDKGIETLHHAYGMDAGTVGATRQEHFGSLVGAGAFIPVASIGEVKSRPYAIGNVYTDLEYNAAFKKGGAGLRALADSTMTIIEADGSTLANAAVTKRWISKSSDYTHDALSATAAGVYKLSSERLDKKYAKPVSAAFYPATMLTSGKAPVPVGEFKLYARYGFRYIVSPRDFIRQIVEITNAAS